MCQQDFALALNKYFSCNNYLVSSLTSPNMDWIFEYWTHDSLSRKPSGLKVGVGQKPGYMASGYGSYLLSSLVLQLATRAKNLEGVVQQSLSRCGCTAGGF